MSAGSGGPQGLAYLRAPPLSVSLTHSCTHTHTHSLSQRLRGRAGLGVAPYLLVCALSLSHSLSVSGSGGAQGSGSPGLTRTASGGIAPYRPGPVIDDEILDELRGVLDINLPGGGALQPTTGAHAHTCARAHMRAHARARTNLPRLAHTCCGSPALRMPPGSASGTAGCALDAKYASTRASTPMQLEPHVRT